MTPIGYFGVLIPAYNYYQGAFLYEEHIKHGRTYLENLRGLKTEGAQTIHRAPGVAENDQALFGAICAVLIEAARTHNESIMTHAGNAIAILASSKYFMVTGEITSHGTGTKFWRMPDAVDSTEAAKAYIENLPEVQAIQLNLVKEAYERLTRKPQ